MSNTNPNGLRGHAGPITSVPGLGEFMELFMREGGSRIWLETVCAHVTDWTGTEEIVTGDGRRWRPSPVFQRAGCRIVIGLPQYTWTAHDNSPQWPPAVFAYPDTPLYVIEALVSELNEWIRRVDSSPTIRP